MTSDPDGTRSLPPIENPFLLSNGQLTNLGHLNDRFGGAVGINNAGQIAGYSYVSAAGQTGDVNGAALAINDAGDIVGWSAAADSVGRTFLHRNGKTIDLNSLPGIAGSGWILQTALEINNAGQIVVSGSFNGQRRYALLTPL